MANEESAQVDSSNMQYQKNIDLSANGAQLGSQEKPELKKLNTDKALEKEKDLSHAEDQITKLPYPRAVPFIISNEFCERFNYYGLRTILVLYLSRQLKYSDDAATIIYHIFSMFVYFLCIFGAIISDSWLGKFKTILYLSLVYVCGSVLVAVGAVPTLDVSAKTLTMIGLALIALGSGGIKPCVSSFGGDQFKMPEQAKQMTTFFSIFYFSINCGSLISTTITPILREDVHCFNEKECYSLALGVPAILMAVSIVIFILGRSLYIVKPPTGNMLLLVSKTIWAAIVTKFRERKTNPRNHWLDYADNKFDRTLISDTKVLMRVLLLYLPLPFFWALFDQQGSRWTLQATRMDGDFGSFNIKADQLQLLNPLLILIFIPLNEVLFYPVLNLVGIRRPLQKLTLGGILAGVSFIISGIVELNLETTYPVLPQANNMQLRIYNTEPCDYIFSTNIPDFNSFTISKGGYYENKNIYDKSGAFDLSYEITASDSSCNSYAAATKTLNQRNAYGLVLGAQNTYPLWYEDSVSKPSRDAMARILANVSPSAKITLKSGSNTEYEETASVYDLYTISRGSYDVAVNDIKIGEVTMKTGGVYTVLIAQNSDKSYYLKQIVITEPNTVNILWLIPQYVVITLAEVVFSVTGLEFSYSQAPVSMKSVLAACWLLTVAFGNVIVVIVAELKLFESQASEFFLFAGLMIGDMLIFMYLAYRYVPNDPNKPIEDVAALNDKTVGNEAENKS